MEVSDTVAKCNEDLTKEEDARPRAVLSQKLLVLLFYANLPLQQSKEYQSLQYKVHKRRLLLLGEGDANAANCLHILEDGSEAYLHLSDYKTQQCHSFHQIPLCWSSLHTTSRSTDHSCPNLFIMKRGNPFQPSMWTAYVQGIFEHYTGHRTGPRRLRSIFTTTMKGPKEGQRA